MIEKFKKWWNKKEYRQKASFLSQLNFFFATLAIASMSINPIMYAVMITLQIISVLTTMSFFKKEFNLREQQIKDLQIAGQKEKTAALIAEDQENSKLSFDADTREAMDLLFNRSDKTNAPVEELIGAKSSSPQNFRDYFTQS